jgi:dTMP kinase
MEAVDVGRGRFIVMEGIDGSGKSTQVQSLATSLGALLTSEPGGTPLGRQLRSLLLEPHRADPSMRTEALLMAADRAEHVARVIEPALASGRWVVSDRFAASTLAYQGHGRGMDLDELRRITRFASGGLEPDLQVLLDLPVTLARQRMCDAADRMEDLGEEFFDRVRAGYMSLARSDPDHWVVIDSSSDEATVRGLVLEAVTTRLGGLAE